MIEKTRGVARNAKVLELRLVGRRRCWPHFDGKKSKVAVITPTKMKGRTITVDGRGKEGDKMAKEASGALIVNFPSQRRRSSPLHLFDERKIDLSDRNCGRKFWNTKEKAVPCNNDSVWNRRRRRKNAAPRVECGTNDTEVTRHDALTCIHPGETADQKTMETRTADGGKETDKIKKKKKAAIAAVAAAASTSLGIAAAIILL